MYSKVYRILFLCAVVIALFCSCKEPTTPDEPTVSVTSVPTGISARSVSSTSVTITWNSVTGADSYNLYYGTEPDSLSGTESVTTETYTLTELTTGTTYYFAVSAVDGGTESKKSSVIAISPVIPTTGTQTEIVSSGSYIRVDSDTMTLKLSGLSANTVYFMKYNPSDDTINAEDTGYVKGVTTESGALENTGISKSVGSVGTATAAVSGNTVSGVFPLETGIVTRYDKTEATEFNAKLVPSDGTSRDMSSEIGISESSATVSYSVGNKRKFWAQNKDDAWIEMNATLQAIGTYCYVWVCDDNYDNASADTTDGNVTTAEAKRVASNFDMVYLPETAVFGEKYDSADAALYNNLVQPSAKISIFVYDIDGDYSSTQTGGVFGFFWSKDMLTDDYLQKNTTDGYRSNETEIFYVDAYFLDYVPKMVYSTLAHEFQHMLEFVHKNIEKKVSPSTWYNEMMSMVCEDMMQSYIGIEDEYSPKGRFPYFYYYYPAGMTTWLSGNSVCISYANAYAFGAFLARNYGGAELIHRIASTGSVDMESVTEALQNQGYAGETCKSVFLNEGRALVYTDTTSAETYPSFNKSVTNSVGGHSFTFSAVNLEDYSSSDNSIIPHLFSATSKGNTDLGTWGFSVHVITSDSYIASLSGTVSVDLTTRPSAEILYVLVK